MRELRLWAAVSIGLLVGWLLPLPAQDRKETAAEKHERETLGNATVAIYGKVVDQDDHPLGGVAVKLELRVGYMITPTQSNTRWDTVEIVTDPLGYFVLAGKKAGSIAVLSMEKEGYELTTKHQRRFEFVHTHIEHHVPDAQHPVIFRMWKKLGAQPMYYQRERIQIPFDGTPVTFDLVKGEQVKSPDQVGDIRVTLIRTPVNVTSGRQRFDWQATIEAIDGGLIETEHEFKYLAPEAGYQPKIEIGDLASNPKWKADRKVAFYIHNRAGKNYGRVELQFNTGWWNEPKTGFGFESFINPAGSRVLEYDSTKRIISDKLKQK